MGDIGEYKQTKMKHLILISLKYSLWDRKTNDIKVACDKSWKSWLAKSDKLQGGSDSYI